MEQLRVGEGTNKLKIRIEHLYLTGVEIGGVDEIISLVLTNRQPFIDGTLFRAIHFEDSIGPVHLGIPTGDRAIFGCEHEDAGSRLALFTDDKVIRIRTVHVVEDSAGWGCGRDTWWGRDGDHERVAERNWPSLSI